METNGGRVFGASRLASNFTIIIVWHANKSLQPVSLPGNDLHVKSSCIITRLTSKAGEEPQASNVKSATSLYSGSRSSYKSCKRAMGSATCSRGRFVSFRNRLINCSGEARKYTTTPRSRIRWRFSLRSTAPPPVANTQLPCMVNSSITRSSKSLNVFSPSRAKNALIVSPRRDSIT